MGRSRASHGAGWWCGVVWRVVWAVLVTPVRTVTEIVFGVSRVVVDGVTVQVELAGAPVQVKVAVRVPGTLAAGLRRRGKTAFWPLWMVTVVLPSAVRAKSTPVPVSWRVWGELGELSVMVRAPVRGPPTVGVKASCKVQAARRRGWRRRCWFRGRWRSHR